MTRAPLDEAALVLLRSTLADLEAGKIIVTELRGDDGPAALGLRLRWLVNGAAPAPATTTATPARAGETCPACGAARLLPITGGPFCPACGHRPAPE